jgi:hypothetical protein
LMAKGMLGTTTSNVMMTAVSRIHIFITWRHWFHLFPFVVPSSS